MKNIAVMATGGIAETMANTLIKMKEINCYAVASRDLEKAKNFAEKYGFKKYYGSYEEMVKDDNVELVYIATPHSHHYENALLCINHGKPALIEKAFTANRSQAEKLLSFAKEKNVFIAEAIWTRYMPMRKKINECIDSGIIGKVSSLTANLGYVVSHINRLREPSLAGGALLDVGVYPLNFAIMTFGDKIKNIASTCVKMDTGVDAQNSFTITYEDGKTAVLHSTVLAQTDRAGVINGDKGYMVIENINNPQSISVYNLDRKLIYIEQCEKQISGYEYQILACKKAIEEKKLECSEMPHKEIINVMKIMDELRAEWGIKYPFE